MGEQQPVPVGGEAAVPLSVEAARRLTEDVRESIGDVQRAAGRLAVRVRAAHDAGAHSVLGYGSWAAYARAEFGVGRSHAYRLLDLARATEEITGTVAALGVLAPVSHAGDTLPLDLPIRAVVELRGRMGEVRELLAERLQLAYAEQVGRLAPELVAAVVADVVAEVRGRPDVAEEDLAAIEVPAGAGYTAETVREGRRLVAELDAGDRRLGALALEIVPAYRSEEQAAGPLRILADDIGGEDVEFLLACRRYAITGDRRAVEEYRERVAAAYGD